MSAAKHPSQLRYLSLGCMHDKVTDEVAIEIARKCPQINTLDLTYCEQLTERGLIAIFQLLPGLKDLTLRRCSKNFTDTVLTRVAELYPRLEVLDLSFCSAITDISMMRVADCCPGLKKLDLYRCIEITDASLLKIAEHCACLKSLNMGYCINVSFSSILCVVSSCPLLEILDLSCTRLIIGDIIRLIDACHGSFKSITLNRCRGISAADCDQVSRLYPRVLIIRGTLK